MDAADRFGEDLSHAHGFDFRADRVGGAVRRNQLFDVRVGDALASLLAEDGVGDPGEDALGPSLTQQSGCRSQSAGGFGNVVDKEDILALDLTDQADSLDFGGTDTVFRDDRERGAERFLVSVGHLHAADVGGDDDEIL